MCEQMCVNLAFFRNTLTTQQLDCHIDLAQFESCKTYKPKQLKVGGIPSSLPSRPSRGFGHDSCSHC